MSLPSGWFYDGETALRHLVDLDAAGDRFSLIAPERSYGPFAFADLVPLGSRDDGPVFGLRGKDGWRLGLTGAIPAGIAARLPVPARYGRWVDRLGLARAALVFAAISAAVLAIVLTVPQWLAPLIPHSVEARLGDAMIGDLGGRICHGAAGEAALAALTARLDGQPDEVQIAVANIPMVNAVALPGNRIVIFDGLLKEAKSADEVAGVVAHELGHVRERHVMQALLRQLGLSVLMGGVDSRVGGTLNGLLSLSYTRGAEASADAYSIAALKEANISPRDTAAFFERMARSGGDHELLTYVSSHPHSAARRKAFAGSMRAGHRYAPALTQQQWSDLRALCAQDKKVQSGAGLEF